MKSDNNSIKKLADDVFASTYLRYPAAMVKGAGCVLIDADGNEYLDFLAGIAVCSLGHCHPKVTEAVCKQVSELVHVSNLYYTLPQTRLAEMLVAHSFGDKVFFANSGAEANEAAIKLARATTDAGRYEIISLEDSFHGRTLATVAATGQPKFHKGFEPVPEGFVYAPFGSLEKLEELVNERTCAIMLEPLQGEGGVRPLAKEYIRGVRELCDKHGVLLIFDEIQTGMGRTGTLFCYEQTGVTPDIMTLAKALGNGFPIGAMIATDAAAKGFQPGKHASTFGGNPVASAAALTVLDFMLEEGFLEEVQKKGAHFQEKMEKLAKKFPEMVCGSRGLGLLQGAVLTEKGIQHGGEIVSKMFERGFLINFAGNKVLRFAPPLIVSLEQIDLVIDELEKVLKEYE